MARPFLFVPPSIAVLALLTVTGCPSTDVGAPCNHGQLEAPHTPTVTFPALACDQLMCMYPAADVPPVEPCQSSADCNVDGASETFTCIAGSCHVSDTHVLSRSMCTMRCESDADCDDGDPGTSCRTGFSCARVQSLGDYCCEKLCVCRDDLDEAGAAVREEACSAGALAGCCDRDPVPDACGP